MKFYHIFILFGIAKLANAGCQGAYQQCGGINYHGSTCCENGYTCKYLNDYYYQCIPNNNNNNNNNNAKTTTTIKKTTTTTVTQYQTNISNTQFPRAQKTVVFNEPKLIKAGEIFDGFAQNGVWTSYGRGLRNLGDCKNVEGGSKDAVFRLETGATLQNVILGSDSIEHVHCIGDGCIIKNVWWDDVCEDALSLKGSSNQGAEFFIIGGGARNGSDKIIQHNSAGTVHIDGFTVNNSGKLYRACGNCKSGYQGVRHAIIKNVNANNVNVLAGINGNYGDTVIFQNINANNGRVCDIYEGNNTGREPTKIESKCQNQKECLCQH